MDKIQELTKLKGLLDNGIIDQKEYEKMKAEILNKANVSQNTISTSTTDKSTDTAKEKDKMVLIKEIATIVEGIYFIEDEDILKDEISLGNVSGFSGWGGLAESLGIKNAEKKIAKKAKQLNANVVLITNFSDPWGGVKIEGEAYKITI
jgi:hypothetical protein